ncbi:MAG: fasciclin domain-containing protein [Gemmatimonadales bacterium]
MNTRPLALVATVLFVAGCSPKPADEGAAPAPPAGSAGMASVVDDGSQKDVVKIAAGSPDHTTLVAAVKAAGLVDVLANSGPYTVFAPTNGAFDKLPAGTVDDLLKPANLARLQAVLRHHVTTSVYEAGEFADGQVLGMADGTSATISKKDGETFLGGARIVASIRGSNGIVHVVDGVVVPN